MDIGARLRIARDAVGYKLDKASQESGIGISSLSEFENGKREPKFSQLSRLAEIYKRPIDFFLTDKPLAEPIMLGRDGPGNPEERKQTKAEFRQLCQQYRRLEVLLGEVHNVELPQLNRSAAEFDYRQAGQLAEKVQREFQLGDIPSASLKQILEERYYVKIFHLSSSGSAISTVSEEFGPAVLLNSGSVRWRRNFDLAHELFHVLTWKIFRTVTTEKDKPTEREEKLANAFASRLLLPTDAVKSRVDAVIGEQREATFGALDEIAREFGVSIDALLWRLVYLYNLPPERVEGYIQESKKVKTMRPRRQSDKPDELPERYCSLAIRALRDGRLAMIKFAKYMRIGYRQAQEYMAQGEGFTDEKVSIPVA